MNGARALSALLLVAGIAAAQIHASSDHWLFADDLTNLRWAMEHNDAPWRALTERHSVHDHVRPLTLIATWAGATLSGGAWWGPRLVTVGLLLGALLGAAMLSRRLAREQEGRHVAFLAASLVLALPGFQDLPWWSAWLCSAGELAAGIWALWATDRALSAGRGPWLGLVLLVVAGLFKEPGWLVAAPLAALAIRHGRPGVALAALGLAAAGVAWTWHPANLLRAASAAEAGQGLLARIDRHLDQLIWPGAGLPSGAAGLEALAMGLTLDPAWPLRAVVLWLPWVGLASARPAVRLALGLLLPAVLILGQAVGDGPSPGWAPVSWVVLALARGGPALPGLLWLVATFLPILPYPGTNAVQQLPGAVGLAVALAVGTAPRWRLPVGMAAAVVALVGAWTRPAPEMVEDVEGTRARRAAILGLASAAQALGSPAVEGWTDDADAREALLLAPLWGSRAIELAPGAARERTGGLQVGAVVLAADPSPLPGPDHLAGAVLPLARARDDRPRPGRSTREEAPDPGLDLDLSPGRYLLGVNGGAGDLDLAVAAADTCAHAWALPAPLPGVQAVAVVVELAPGCGPLRVRRTAPAGARQGGPVQSETGPFLVTLPPPRLSMPDQPVRPPVVDVRRLPGRLPAGTSGGPRGL